MGFLQDITGSTARKQLKKSKREADAALQQGYDDAQGFYEQGYDELTPYAEGGQTAFTRYNQLLGLGTPEERTAAQQIYSDDAGFQGQLGLQSNALLRQLNARGSTYGGRAALAGARVGAENYTNYLDRLGNLGAQGGQYAGQQSNIRLGQGDSAFNFGATRAGNAINYGNARAQASTIGVNNLLNAAGTAAKVATAFSDIRLKRNIIATGETHAGIPVFEYEYLWSPQRFKGVMAQDVLMAKPEAVMVHDSGFYVVDYGRL